MNSAFLLQHLHILPSGEEDIKTVGVYRTAINAREAVGRLRNQLGFCDHPEIIDIEHDENEQGFYIDEYQLDQDHWTEGFVTMVGDKEFKE